jgi:hypothetical protein
MDARRLALGLAVASLTLAWTAVADGHRRRAPSDQSGVRYGADVSVAGIYDRDGSAWAGGAAARVGYAFDGTFSLYASAIAMVGPYFRVGLAGFVEAFPSEAVRLAVGVGATTTPKLEFLCSDAPCGPDGYMCFDPCEHNHGSLAAILRVAPTLAIPTADDRTPFSLAFQVELEVQPDDGEVRGVSMMSFAFDDVAR